jgi:hypothetical protein
LRSAFGSRFVAGAAEVSFDIVPEDIVPELEGVVLVSAGGAVLLAGWLVSAAVGAGAVLLSGVDWA